MERGRAAVVDFMRDEVLALAGPYKPGSEPWSALCRVADKLQDAAQAIRRHEARDAGGGAPVIGVVNGEGRVQLLGRPEA